MKGNKKCGSEFVFLLIFYNIIAMALYRNSLFRVIPGHSYTFSKLMLWFISIASTTVGYLITRKKQRNSFSVFSSILLGFCIYAALTYGFLKKALTGALIIAVIISAVLAVFMFSEKTKKTVTKISQTLINTHRIVAIAAMVVVIPTFGGSYFGKTLLRSNVKAVSGIESKETIAGNMETLEKLKTEKWRTLSANEKINVLQTVANIEARYLGLDHELNVEAAELPGTRLGEYTDTTNRIIISLKELENGKSIESLNTVCHEAYHAYQNALVKLYEGMDEKSRDLYIFKDAKKYKSEFDDYKELSDGYNDYYDQACEKDARSYAKNAVFEYMTRIYGTEEYEKEFNIVG